MAVEYNAEFICVELQISQATLRSWTKHFPDIILEANSKGKRYYGIESFEAIKRVHQLIKERGFTLSGAKREYQRQEDEKAAKQVAIARLEKLRSQLNWLYELL